jgi:hypothetical protein
MDARVQNDINWQAMAIYIVPVGHPVVDGKSFFT